MTPAPAIRAPDTSRPSDETAQRTVGMPQVIVVDDEPELRAILSDYLRRHGFAVRAVADAVALDAAMSASQADLLILDIAMPGEDGLSIARRVRSDSSVPILMLTAAADIVDRIIGLEIGADDYVTKPFDMRELLARVRALLRRSKNVPSRGAGSPCCGSRATVRFGAITLDMDAHRLLRDDGSVVSLTAMEFDLLNTFVEHPNRVLSRDRLLDLAHHRREEPFDRSIDIRIARLRRKIESDPRNPQIIRTVHGCGYIFVQPK
jgi:two-component system phosphate regulon response regulator OmpR